MPFIILFLKIIDKKKLMFLNYHPLLGMGYVYRIKLDVKLYREVLFCGILVIAVSAIANEFLLF